MSKHSEMAKNLFKQGYNCSQAVFGSFCDLTGIDFETAMMISSSFGGGMGRLREVCGAVSGMFMTIGVLYGYSNPKDAVAKKEHYARVQELAKKFEEQNGSIVCRELLGLSVKKQEPTPEARTESYYKKRPCAELVEMAALFVDKYIEENPIE